MRKAELEHFRKLLIDLRRRLSQDVTQLSDEALRANGDGGNLSSTPIHMADVGTDAFEQELTLSLMENEEEAITEIDGALKRLEKGVFGQCEECGAEILKERLKAIPYARYCVDCARKREK